MERSKTENDALEVLAEAHGQTETAEPVGPVGIGGWLAWIIFGFVFLAL